jgi:hypothetical protein
MQRLSVPLSFVAVLVGCGMTATGPSDVSRAQLASAPTRVVTDGVGVTLTAFLTRDFMPTSPPDGNPPAGVLRIKTENGTPVSESVVVNASGSCSARRLGQRWSSNGRVRRLGRITRSLCGTVQSGDPTSWSTSSYACAIQPALNPCSGHRSS